MKPFFVLVLISLVILINVQVGVARKRDRVKEVKSGKKPKRTSHRGKQILRRLPRDLESTAEDQELRSLCEELCEKTWDMECKGTLTFLRFDDLNKTCICRDNMGTLLSRKLLKAKSGLNPGKKLLASKALKSCHNASIDNHDPCREFCKKVAKVDSFKCSPGKKLCECYRTQEEAPPGVSMRGQRQLVIEEFTDTGEEIVGLDLHPPTPASRAWQGRHAQGHAHGHAQGRHPKFFPRHSYYNAGFDEEDEDELGGVLGGLRGCSAYKCLGECPRECDSLCRQNGRCYCSCPEDLSYDYYDEDYPLSSLLGK